jgi:hypothetical protein
MANLNRGVREDFYVNTKTTSKFIYEEAYSSAATSQHVHTANDDEEAMEDHYYEEIPMNEYETDRGITSVERLNAPNTHQGNAQNTHEGNASNTHERKASNTQTGSTNNRKKIVLKVILIIILIIVITAVSAILVVFLMPKPQGTFLFCI